MFFPSDFPSFFYSKIIKIIHADIEAISLLDLLKRQHDVNLVALLFTESEITQKSLKEHDI